MSINPISGHWSRAAHLVGLFADYGKLGNHKGHKSGAASDAPTPPVVPPKQAIFSPYKGSRSFAVGFRRSLLGGRGQTNIGKAVIGAHTGVPGLFAEEQENPEVIAPVPRNVHGDQPTQPEKTSARLIAGTPFDLQQSAMTPSDTGESKGQTSSMSDSARQAVHQRMAFFLIQERKLPDLPMWRR